jgi:hypothetical protein
VFSEESSPFYEANAAAAELGQLDEDDRLEGNRKYSINGYLYCNIPGLNMTMGERWVGDLGEGGCMASVHWNTCLTGGEHGGAWEGLIASISYMCWPSCHHCL